MIIPTRNSELQLIRAFLDNGDAVLLWNSGIRKDI